MISRYQKYKASYQAYYQAHREEILKRKREWRRQHPDYHRQYRMAHPEMYRNSERKHNRNNPKKRIARRKVEELPLNQECEFCGRTEKLEHGHIDYDLPEIYVTVCHQCNFWMDKPLDYLGELGRKQP